MCALISAQKCLLCLGDLARYKETIQETCSYGVARQHYQKASSRSRSIHSFVSRHLIMKVGLGSRGSEELRLMIYTTFSS